MHLSYHIVVYPLLLAMGVGIAGANPTSDGAEKQGERNVSAATGWKLWQSAGCASCHGSDQGGGSAPSLIEAIPNLSQSEFESIILDGREARGMPRFEGFPGMEEGIDSLFLYLKGRANGSIGRGMPASPSRKD